MLFKPDTTLEKLNAFTRGNMCEYLGIEFVEIGEDYLVAKMPVDHRTIQPMGILHGGASVVLAESIGSLAGNFIVDNDKQACVGLDINANHLRKVVKGNVVYGKATPIHLGRTTQVWEIKITNDKQELVCISRLTLAVININQ